jgi:dienelactone hydrolase
MRLRLVMFVLSVGMASIGGHCETTRTASPKVRLISGSYADFRQLLAREAPSAEVTISASLDFPEETENRYPGVVVVHTAGGYQEANEGAYAAELRKAGFATLVYDSFAARGTTGVALLQRGPGIWPSAVADAYAALGLLASHPRIDADRIAIVGFSFGGEIAHLAGFESIRSAMTRGRARFAAHVAYYPAGVFGAVAGPQAYTGSPILMLLGEKDDNLPITKVEGYLRYARAAGYPVPIETVTYRGAYHAWTVPTLNGIRFYPEYTSAKKCPLLLLGPARPLLLDGDQTKPFDPAALSACQASAPGYSMAYDAGVRARSWADALAFLRRHL